MFPVKPLLPPCALRRDRVFVVSQSLATTSDDAPAKTVMRLKRTSRTPTPFSQQDDGDDRRQSLAVEGASGGDGGWAETKATLRSCDDRVRRARQTNESRAADENAADDRENVAPDFRGDADLRESERRVKPRDGRWRRKEEDDRAAKSRRFRNGEGDPAGDERNDAGSEPDDERADEARAAMNVANAAVTPTKNGVA